MLSNNIAMFDKISNRFVTTFLTENEATLVRKLREMFLVDIESKGKTQKIISEKSKDYDVILNGYFDDECGNMITYPLTKITRKNAIAINDKEDTIIISRPINLGNVWKIIEKSNIMYEKEIMNPTMIMAIFKKQEEINYITKIQELEKELKKVKQGV